ncbi:uncharacterized protein LOC116852085 [Odontomachus brunneus]|uniref:uncharacterized protein LOC116852085 n=1 Tax=Odontomachus brunneus TaxID=486640 RepID=UPI0013F23588|nr:uncharacterized protein LOC116852085 [Odontomachus brunneus]
MRDRFAITWISSAIVGLLLLVTVCCNGLQYQPLDAYVNGEDCALILDSRGRTSVYDYTYNLLRGSFPAAGGATQTCITYDAVNHAYVEARKRINVARPKAEMWRPEDLATVGELLLDITTNLAQTYGLTYEEIEKSLPLIDTSKTFIREVCPAFLSNVECRPGKYRRYDGLCTNLQNPTWGASLSPFARLMSPQFADGLTAPRISITGHNLPLSRIVSRTMHPDEGYHDHAGTVMVIAWGQFMDHDYTLTATPLDPLNRNDPEECCSRPPHLKNPYCNEILIPEDDYFYRLFNVRCMDFVRAFPAVRPGCRLGSRVPFNLLTGVLDGNTVYGITEAFARKLRTGYGGLLRMNPVFAEYGLKDLLPLKLDIPDEGCTRPNRTMYCFEAGEIRVNEQLVLTCMHTLMAREHNRLAKALALVNPHWDDEILFQEARRIVIAEIQHITYNEFLPILLGKDVMEKFGLLLEKEKYWDGYDPSINPGVIDAFAAAAFRFGHSLLPTAVERWSKAHKFIASKRLSDLIRRPYDLYRAGVFDEYFMGLMNQVAQAMDDSITQEVTNHLFKKVGAKFGMDLVSFNMQRGREFGIPSYMEFRKYCGLPGADSFEELFGSMPNETIRRYSTIFEHPADVDLWSGGVSERPLPGSMLGPTFACVIATQFSHSRRGDRFWYELSNQPSSFTLEQLNEIRKTKLARVICDNTDLIDTIQIYPMVLPDHDINPRVPCRTQILPSIDLSKWADFPTTSHSAQYQWVEEQLLDVLGQPVKPAMVREHYDRQQAYRIFFENINGIASYLGFTRNLKLHDNDLSFFYLKSLIFQDTTTKKSAQAASEIKPVMQPAYISKFFGKLKISSAGKNSMSNIEKKLSEPWWTPPQSVERKKLRRHMEESNQETSQQPKRSLNQQTSLQFLANRLSPRAEENQNSNLDLDVDAIKITTIIETIRRKVQRSARTAEEANDIWGTIAKIRSRRSLRESENDDAKATDGARYDQDRREGFFPKTKRAADARDLKTASSASIPSTVFYKRIWEYINGTRSHSDLTSGYSALENNSNKTDNSTCTKQDPIVVSQSRKGEIKAVSPTIKAGRELYKRIWDIINATSASHQASHEKAVARPKRDVNSPGNTFAAVSDRSCVQDKIAVREEDQPTPTTINEEAWLGQTDITQEVPAPDLYESRFKAVANKTAEWQPKAAIPAVNVTSLNDWTIPLRANETTETADLNQPEPRSAQNNTDDSSGNSSTVEYAGEETRGDKPQNLTETGPPYPPGRENSSGTSFSSSADTIDKASREDDRAQYVEHNETDSSLYDASNIPYVEVPDYSDQREDTLNKSNPDAVELKEYDNGDYGDYVEPESSYRAGDAASKSPSDEIQLLPGIPAGNDGQGSSLDASASRSRCIEGQDSAECAGKRRHSKDATNSDARRPPEASVKREDAAVDFAPIHFDINEYRKPFNLDDLFKNDPVFKHTSASKAETRHEDDERNADRENGTKESEKSDRNDESEESARDDRKDESRKHEPAYPKADWYNYFVRNADFRDGSDEATSQEDQSGESHAEEEAKNGETISGSYNSHDDEDFLRHIFGKDNDEESQSDVVDPENEFSSRHFTEDVLRQLRENSTATEDRRRKESSNREDVHKTLSRILDKKDRFSRLDENLDKMIEKGEAVPIRYNNFWSLEYESPRRKNNEEEKEEDKEEDKEEEKEDKEYESSRRKNNEEEKEEDKEEETEDKEEEKEEEEEEEEA